MAGGGQIGHIGRAFISRGDAHSQRSAHEGWAIAIDALTADIVIIRCVAVFINHKEFVILGIIGDSGREFWLVAVGDGEGIAEFLARKRDELTPDIEIAAPRVHIPHRQITTRRVDSQGGQTLLDRACGEGDVGNERGGAGHSPRLCEP